MQHPPVTVTRAGKESAQEEIDLKSKKLLVQAGIDVQWTGKR